MLQLMRLLHRWLTLHADQWTNISPQVPVFQVEDEIGGVDCSVVIVPVQNAGFALLM